MKKTVATTLFTVAALPLLYSCASTALDTPERQAEISYCVVSVKTPRTKADYDKTQPFGAWAWYLPVGKSWASDRADAIPYVSGADGISADRIEYLGSVWKSQTNTYYWPKAGSLSFFAYSPYNLPAGAGSVSCNKASGEHQKDFGVSLTDYNIASQCDFLVADPAIDKTSAETTYGLNGVPTLFRHTLAKVTVRATLEKLLTEGTKKVTITNVTLKNLYLIGDYKYSASPQWSSSVTSLGDQTLTAASKDIATTDLIELGWLFVIPQPFGLRGTVYPEIEISYTDENGNAQTASRKIYELSAKATSYDPGRHYIYTISFGKSDQPIIFGSQQVEDWVVKDSDSIQY